MKKRWIFLMAAMMLIAVAGLFATEPTFECDWDKINAADVAWLITATIFGTVLTGIFIQEGLVAGTWGGFVVFLCHLLAVAIVVTYTFGVSYLGYWLIDKMIPMRVSAYSEKVGLDYSQHDEHYGFAHVGEREIAERALFTFLSAWEVKNRWIR